MEKPRRHSPIKESRISPDVSASIDYHGISGRFVSVALSLKKSNKTLEHLGKKKHLLEIASSTRDVLGDLTTKSSIGLLAAAFISLEEDYAVFGTLGLTLGFTLQMLKKSSDDTIKRYKKEILKEHENNEELRRTRKKVIKI